MNIEKFNNILNSLNIKSKRKNIIYNNNGILLELYNKRYSKIVHKSPVIDMVFYDEKEKKIKKRTTSFDVFNTLLELNFNFEELIND